MWYEWTKKERREELQNGGSVTQCCDQGHRSFHPALPHTMSASSFDGQQQVSNPRATSPQDKIQKKKETKFLAFPWSKETSPRTTLLQTSSHANSWANHWGREWETWKPGRPTWGWGLTGFPEACARIRKYEQLKKEQIELHRRENRRMDAGQTSISILYNISMEKLTYGVRKSNYINW